MELKKSNAFLCGERKWIAAITTCFVNFWLIFKTQEQKYFFQSNKMGICSKIYISSAT